MIVPVMKCKLSKGLSILAYLVIIDAVFAAKGHADTWSPATPPHVSDIQSQTDATLPANRNRTDIGIGEGLFCTIDPLSWSDVDACSDGIFQDDLIPDKLGGYVWTSTGDYVGSSTDGPSFYVKAPIKGSDGTINVAVDVSDSGTHGSTEVVSKSKTFNVKIPNSVTIVGVIDISTPKSGRTQGASGSLIGQYARYYYQIQPSTVNFMNVSFREKVPAVALTWPSGNNVTTPAKDITSPVIDHAGLNNRLDDLVSILWSKLLLGTPPADFHYSATQTLYFFNGTTYQQFKTQSHDRYYRAADLKAIWLFSTIYS
jgi:hypothetical protein